MIQRLLSTLFFTGFFLSVSAQSGSISPYSRYGIGDLQFAGFTNQLSMGGVGVAQNDSFNINIINPAGYAAIKMALFDAGIRGDITTISSSTKSTNKSNVTLNYFSLGFPLVRRWAGMAFGLVPYSSTGYTITTAALNSQGTLYKNYYTGSGGISRFFLGAGTKITKNISAGINTSYLFGSIKRTRKIEYPYDNTYYSNSNVVNTNVGDFNFNYGILGHFDSIFGVKNKNAIARFDTLAYDTLSSHQKMQLGLYRPIRLTFGFSGSFHNSLNSKYDDLTYNYKYSAFGSPITKDTIQYEAGIPSTTNIATNYNFGVALEDIYHWRIEADMNIQNWSNFSSYDVKDTLQNSYRIAVGGEWMPNYRSNGFFNRIYYRIGFHYGRSRLNLNNTSIDDIAGTFGLGLPVSGIGNKAFGANLTRVNFGFEIGHRGTTENNLIKEQYFRLNFGIVFTEQWFIKKKYD